MLPDRLRGKEQEIRKAVARRQYGDLPRKLEDLQRAAAEHMAELPANDSRRLEVIGSVRNTIEWARLMLITQRQIWSAELQRLPLIVTYTRGFSADSAGGHSARRTCLDL